MRKEGNIAHVFILTIPNCMPDTKSNAKSTATKHQVNAQLIQQQQQDAYHVIDLAAWFDFLTMSEEERTMYWDDHIHFSAAG